MLLIDQFCIWLEHRYAKFEGMFELKRKMLSRLSASGRLLKYRALLALSRKIDDEKKGGNKNEQMKRTRTDHSGIMIVPDFCNLSPLAASSQGSKLASTASTKRLASEQATRSTRYCSKLKAKSSNLQARKLRVPTKVSHRVVIETSTRT